ncbi:4Fe-4S binding protein [Carboxylicivirga taeanensis]|uniref:4Fe-4S binding protein n=1 Tax=Carboxylicivirga taeanensis TaxID=1416875 RepID=UPI003F6E388A
MKENRKVHAIFFSPARSTKKVVEAVASGICGEIVIHDITQGIQKAITIDSGDVAVVGVPAYSGRVPALARQYLEQIKGNGARAVMTCVYGNNDYQFTLDELVQICSDAGFIPISSGAFVARHSIFQEVAKGRPDKNDLDKARQFGKQSVRHSRIGADGKRRLRCQHPNHPAGEVPLVAKVNSNCNFCGACARLCPVGAIDIHNPAKTNKKKCIACARCVEMCSYNARKFSGLMYYMARKRFEEKNKERKEIEVFIPL